MMHFKTAVRAGLTAAMLIAAATSTASARPLNEVLASKRLFVVAYEDNKPFSWTADDGTVMGIDVDLAKAIAAEIGVDADIELRMAGEAADQDVRVNVLRGTVGGGKPGDVMMHVPTDKDFAARFKGVIISNAYFQQTVAVAIDPKRIPQDATFDIFKTEKISVKLATVSDYFLMGYQDGALVNNISHFTRGPNGAKEFLSGETAALMGVRSEIEGNLFEQGARAEFITPEMSGIVRNQWIVGMAIDDNSRDLGYALENALTKLRNSGRLKEIFAKHGVTYLPPPEG
jgi:ABC-type amino acid transport substrate-binding protein